jgi:hypothetical protein
MSHSPAPDQAPDQAPDHVPLDGERWSAVGNFYHAYFTGLILMIANRQGPQAAGQWTRALFRRQHHLRFLASFEKLGLSDLPDAVACAQYHYLSNAIGGVDVEYMYSHDQKAWVRFCHPRWIYAGTAICGVPIEVGQGYIHGWYGHNGVSLNNPRLGFVCTSQDVTAEYGFAGYFQEFDHDLGPDERVRYRPEEIAPAFDPAAAPALDVMQWPADRLQKANRNYAMDFVANGLIELLRCFGTAEATYLGQHTGQLIGRQFYRQLQQDLDVTGDRITDFAMLMSSFIQAAGDGCDWQQQGDTIIIQQHGWRLMRDADTLHPSYFDAWNGLWSGALNVHDRFRRLQVTARADHGDSMFEWQIK